jgi:spore coat polysaccharide biosynthesis protein SpsF
MSELDAWKGDFGATYTDRNVIEWQARQPGWREVLQGLTVQSVLEIGCNRGHNLVAISDLLGEQADVVGIEPNRHAQRVARGSSDRIAVLNGDAFALPFKDRTFDLVFTAGVLIHIALARLPAALAEIHRVSRRYIVALEYFAEEETSIPYRGRDDLLWKRNFLKHYQEQFPELVLVRSGYFGAEQGFDRTHWWVLEKP